MEEQSGQKYVQSLIYWYEGFLRRHPGSFVRTVENIPKSRLNAKQKATNIAHFFSLLRQYESLPEDDGEGLVLLPLADTPGKERSKKMSGGCSSCQWKSRSEEG